jgi:hypothetical protein
VLCDIRAAVRSEVSASFGRDELGLVPPGAAGVGILTTVAGAGAGAAPSPPLPPVLAAGASMTYASDLVALSLPAGSIAMARIVSELVTLICAGATRLAAVGALPSSV